MAVAHQVTPGHHSDRENIREAQTRIEVTNHTIPYGTILTIPYHTVHTMLTIP